MDQDQSRLSKICLDLASFPFGNYNLNESQVYGANGWISVEPSCGKKFIMWSSHEHYHDRSGGSICKAIYITKDGKLSSYFESLINMWMVWGHGKGGKDDFNRAILFAEWACKHLAFLTRR